jgi:hypothetical protein
MCHEIGNMQIIAFLGGCGCLPGPISSEPMGQRIIAFNFEMLDIGHYSDSRRKAHQIITVFPRDSPPTAPWRAWSPAAG